MIDKYTQENITQLITNGKRIIEVLGTCYRVRKIRGLNHVAYQLAIMQ